MGSMRTGRHSITSSKKNTRSAAILGSRGLTPARPVQSSQVMRMPVHKSVHVSMHMSVCMHMLASVHISVHVCMHMCARINTCLQTCLRMRIHAHPHVWTHVRTHVHVCAHVYACLCTCPHTHLCSYIRLGTWLYTCMCTCRCDQCTWWIYMSMHLSVHTSTLAGPCVYVPAWYVLVHVSRLYTRLTARL